ncbi:MAG: LysM peptidoglycan-binding domain-containing protein, partial [Acidimicrobiia bacterium]
MPHAKKFRVFSAAVVLVGAVIAASADYVVKSGDTVVGIAGQYGVSPSDLASANNLADPDLIGIGQILIIPRQGPAGMPGTHVVASGETVAEVAVHYGTTVNAIVEANGLSNPNLIGIGQELLIPGFSAAPVAAPAAVVEGATYTV